MFGLLGAAACDDSGDDLGACVPGELDCVCDAGQCITLLNCVDDVCVPQALPSTTGLADDAETGDDDGDDDGDDG